MTDGMREDDIGDAIGLGGVVVAHTEMSGIDGEAGRLVIGGEDVEVLADGDVEAVCARLWYIDPDHARAELGRGRGAAFEALPRLGDALERVDGMDALRASLAHLEDEHPAAIAGATAVFAAAWWRRRRGLDPVPPDSTLDHAADYWRMCTGRTPEPAVARAMRAYLVTVSDHGMNASTFAARVVTSTRSDAVSAVVAAVGALKGPLHGGAPGPVLDMLDAIGEPDRAEAWVRAELEAGRRIMGMGHRVYRVRDPRAAVLEARARDIGGQRVALARAVEATAARVLAERYPERRLCANVEFFTAVLLDSIELDRAQFSPTFAVGRVVGWLGHIAEERARGRLIRPRARYLGPAGAMLG